MIQREYRRAILERFAERYPGSAHAKGGRPLRLGRWDNCFSELSEDLDAPDLFLDEAEKLAEEGVIELRWEPFRTGENLRAMILIDPGKLYAALGEPIPQQLCNQAVQLLEHSAGKTAGTGDIIRESLLQKYRDGTIVFKRIKKLEQLLQLLQCDPQFTGSLPLRRLSVLLYSDSKLLERTLPEWERRVRRLCGFSLRQTYRLQRSYPTCSFMLCGTELEFSDGVIWDINKKNLTLPLAELQALGGFRWQNGTIKNRAVLAVENRETYYCAVRLLAEGRGLQRDSNSGSFDGVVMVSGHRNRAVKELLKKLADCGVQIHCFFDLDPAGVQIYATLHQELPGSVTLWNMNQELFREYENYQYPLPEGELRRGRALQEKLTGAAAGLISACLQTGRGLEQEIIPLERERL